MPLYKMSLVKIAISFGHIGFLLKRAIFIALGNPCRLTLVLKLASPFRYNRGRMTNITKALMISDTLIIVMLLLGEEKKSLFYCKNWSLHCKCEIVIFLVFSSVSISAVLQWLYGQLTV